MTKEGQGKGEKGESVNEPRVQSRAEADLISHFRSLFQLIKQEFKDRFRNVSRIMDCVGCDKCRLWGKLQVSGVGTALKILFELDEKALE